MNFPKGLCYNFDPCQWIEWKYKNKKEMGQYVTTLNLLKL
jgi:hypothetical protein